MQSKLKSYEIKANFTFKLAESFYRILFWNQELLLKTILAVSIESKEMNSSCCKITFDIFMKQKKKNENAQILASRSRKLQWSSDVIVQVIFHLTHWWIAL